MTTIEYIDRNRVYKIPGNVAVCRICGAALIIEDITEWYDDGQVAETGLHIACTTEPDIDSDDWSEWHRGHYRMPYVDWLPVQRIVYGWFDKRYRLKT